MGSMLFPNMMNGKARSGGFLAKNPYKGKNAKAPDAKGRVWVNNPGWHFIAGWNRRSDAGQGYVNIVLEDMTDEHAKKYCAHEHDREPPR